MTHKLLLIIYKSSYKEMTIMKFMKKLMYFQQCCYNDVNFLLF